MTRMVVSVNGMSAERAVSISGSKQITGYATPASTPIAIISPIVIVEVSVITAPIAVVISTFVLFISFIPIFRVLAVIMLLVPILRMLVLLEFLTVTVLVPSEIMPLSFCWLEIAYSGGNKSGQQGKKKPGRLSYHATS